MRRYLSLILFLALTAGVATVGSQFMPGAWYASLNKPFFNPPNWVFAPVWTVLYLMMAIAVWRVWRAVGADWSIVLWVLQLGLNGLWSWLFFGLNRPDLALMDILILLLLIFIVVIQFLRRERLAGVLMLPYLAWVAFASALNFSLWILNPPA